MTRCAIYTRKSSDEGLDQQFNSLDAQREACEAYVLSQIGEGWTALPQRYDDGGFSGGSMRRPALQDLLTDIAKGQIDVVVVYKIDRLTRSLADFARIVEQFDARQVSFISVTQAFNTTSPMGRLTLNVLLTFAQFEREVTGERIRDKLAASKAKGMWMGGLPPLGYDSPTGTDRILRVNRKEAAIVRRIFQRYLELGSVHALVTDLAMRGVVSKFRQKADGTSSGGQALSRGAVFHLLKNRIYRGEIVHKDAVYPGLHEAIVPIPLFDRAQRQLDKNRNERARSPSRTAPLAGKLFLADGQRLTPTHSRGANGQTYRYYVPICMQVGRSEGGTMLRLPSSRFENMLRSILARVVLDGRDPLEVLHRVDIRRDRLALSIPISLNMAVQKQLGAGETVEPVDERSLGWSIPWKWPSKGGDFTRDHIPVRRDPVLIKALRTAYAMLDHDPCGGPVLREVPKPRHQQRLARLAFLSPRLQADIVEGRQPAGFTLAKILRGKIPACWNEQELWARQPS